MIPLYELAMKRGWRCEACGFATHYLERHHCLIHRMKGKPELDDERNIMLLCHKCHEKHGNSWDTRLYFWKIQLGRYPDLFDWYCNLPVKVKDKFSDI